MFKSKIREQEIPKVLEDKYYEVIFLTIVEKTSKNDKDLLQRWARFTGTNLEILERVLFKLKLSTYSNMKYLKMRALAYFGVTVKEIKEVYGITANYARIPKNKLINTRTVCTAEEIAEIRLLIDRLIYFFWSFKYIKFDENGIVLKDYKEYNKQRICETYFRTSLFHFRQRYRKVFEDLTIKPLVMLAYLLNMNPQDLDFLSSKINTTNRASLGEIRSLLYYAFDVSIKDAKTLLQHSQQAMNVLHRKYENRLYNPITSEDEFEIIKHFFRSIYENTKYISCLKGVDKDE